MSGKLGFGYLYDMRNPAPWARDYGALYRETVDLVVETERLGFAGAWVPEHHLADDGYCQVPNMVLAAIAARTSRIRLGTGIALAPLYHPLRFAEECVALDLLSGGRLEMALAIGYRKREYDAFGLDFRQRGARFDAFLDIATRLWRGETVTHAGPHYSLTEARLVPTPARGHIPLYIGGFAPKAMERVAKYADGYFGNGEVCDLYLAKLAEAGRDPAQGRIRIPGLFLTVAEDKAAAMEELAPHYHYVNNAYSVFMAEDQAIGLDAPALAPMGLEDFKRSGILTILTPEEAIAYFKRLQAKMPLDHFMMMRPPGLPAERFQHYARVFAEKVMPEFA